VKVGWSDKGCGGPPSPIVRNQRVDLPGHEVLPKLAADVGEQHAGFQRPPCAALHEVAVQDAPVHAARHPAIGRQQMWLLTEMSWTKGYP